MPPTDNTFKIEVVIDFNLYCIIIEQSPLHSGPSPQRIDCACQKHHCVEAPRVYRFPVFEKSFCEELVEELEHFEQSSAPKGRPNTMNHYGVMDPFLQAETTWTHHLFTAQSFIFHLYCVMTSESLARCGPISHKVSHYTPWNMRGVFQAGIGRDFDEFYRKVRECWVIFTVCL